MAGAITSLSLCLLKKSVVDDSGRRWKPAPKDRNAIIGS